MISFFINIYRNWKHYFHNLRLLSVLNVNGFMELTEIMEMIYPGFKNNISMLIDRHERHMVDRCLDFINANGGLEKLTDYYNSLDENGKSDFQSSFKRLFKDGDAFESQVLYFDNVSRKKGFGMLAQLMCDLKDGIIKSSIKSGKRTIDDWRLFLRRERESGHDMSLGVLDEIEQSQNQDISQKEVPNASAENIPDFPIDVIDHIYNEYDDVVFKHISSITEFRKIILRLPHSERLVESGGRKIHLYHILWRLHKLPPSRNHSLWLEDICSECKYDLTTLSKKYNDSSTMKDENRKIFERLSRFFNQQDTTLS